MQPPANATHCEHARRGGLDEIGGACEGPTSEILAAEIAPGFDEPLLVQRDAACSQAVFGSAPVITTTWRTKSVWTSVYWLSTKVADGLEAWVFPREMERGQPPILVGFR